MNSFDLFIKKIINIFLPKISDGKKDALVQFVKFGIVGATNTILSYVLYVLTIFVLKPVELEWDFVPANLISFFLSVLWSFYWNNKYVFTVEEGKKRNWAWALFKTYLSYAFTGILLTNLLSTLWIKVLGIDELIAPLINLVISVPLNFIINKFWAFKTKKKEENAE